MTVATLTSSKLTNGTTIHFKKIRQLLVCFKLFFFYSLFYILRRTISSSRLYLANISSFSRRIVLLGCTKTKSRNDNSRQGTHFRRYFQVLFEFTVVSENNGAVYFESKCKQNRGRKKKINMWSNLSLIRKVNLILIFLLKAFFLFSILVDTIAHFFVSLFSLSSFVDPSSGVTFA